MIKSKRQKDILMGVITSLTVIVLFAISYAAFSQTLNINGTGTVRNSTWNIHFVGSGELEPSNTISSSVKVLSKPSISATTVGDYRVSLTTPGDTISYTFSVINEGDYNAKISDFNLPTPECKVNGSQFAPDESAVNVCAKLDYTLTYENGTPVANNDTLLSKETKTMILTLTYNSFDNEELLPTSDVEIDNLGFTINYVQDGSALVNDDGTTPYRRTYTKYNVGQTFTISGDDYYVISDSEYNEYVTLIKANPLTVAEVNEYGVGHTNKYTQSSVGTAYNYNGYGGMAYYSSETCGYVNGSHVRSGCESENATSYATSDIKYVVDGWVRSKFTNGELATDANGYEARLITFEEVHSLGYGDEPQLPCGSSCGVLYYLRTDDVPEWLYKSSYWYWTMSQVNNSSAEVWRVTEYGEVYNSDVYYDYRGGEVRPVINVYKSRL